MRTAGVTYAAFLMNLRREGSSSDVTLGICKLVQRVHSASGCAHERATVRRSIVNFRYSGGWIHIVLNVWLGDSEYYLNQSSCGRRPYVRIWT